MGWFEVINIALNAKQSYDLHQTRQRLQDIEGQAITDVFVKQVLDSARNLVFETANDVKSLEDHLKRTPQPAYVALKLLEWRLEEVGISPSVFPEFTDKEYVRDVQNNLVGATQKSRDQLTPDEINQAEECFLAIIQTPLLKQAVEAQSAHEQQAIEIQSAREQLQEFEDEWKTQRAEKQKWTLAGMGALAYVPIAFSMSCVCGGISDISSSNAWRVIAYIASIVFLLSIFAGITGGIIFFAKNPSAEYGALKKKQAELKKVISSNEDFLSDIPPGFDEQNSQELRALQTARQQLIDQIMGQVEGYDKFLASSEAT